MTLHQNLPRVIHVLPIPTEHLVQNRHRLFIAQDVLQHALCRPVVMIEFAQCDPEALATVLYATPRAQIRERVRCEPVTCRCSEQRRLAGEMAIDGRSRAATSWLRPLVWWGPGKGRTFRGARQRFQ